MSIGTPSFRNRPGRIAPRTIPDSRPNTSVPRPRSFAANINRAPSPVPTRGQVPFQFQPGRGAAQVALNIATMVRSAATQVGDQYWAINDQGNGTAYYKPSAWGIPLAQKTHTATRDVQLGTSAWNRGALLQYPPQTYNVWHYTSVLSFYTIGIQTYAVCGNPVLWEPGLPYPSGQPGVWVQPLANPLRPPRFRPREEPVPRLAGRPLIRPGIGFDLFPNAPPRPVEVKATKPPDRVREVKATGAAARAVAIVNAAFNSATEVADVLAIFWDHVEDVTPGNERTFWETMTRMAEEPHLWAEVDWEAMVSDMIANEVEDQIIGRLHGAKRKLRTEWGEPTYGSVFTGP